MVDNWRILDQLRRRWGRALGLIVQPNCLLCGAIGQRTMDLCTLCAAMLPRPPPIAAEPSAPGCILQLAALEYAWPVDLLVQDLKFAGNWPVARVFGQLLAEARLELPLPMPQVVIPVPLHPTRLAERGFNQAEHIARQVCGTLQISLAPELLQRRRATATQSRLNARARRDNLHEAFAWGERSSRPPREPWQHVALLDDVITTGSTLTAATSALRRAGVRRIEWWTAAAATLGNNSHAG